MCPSCITGVWSSPAHCGTAADNPSRTQWWSVSWSGSLLLPLSSLSSSVLILRSDISPSASSSSFPSHCSYSSWVGPSKHCLLPSRSPLMKNVGSLEFWFWCCLFTLCCSCLPSLSTCYWEPHMTITLPSAPCLICFLDSVLLQT